MLAELRVQGLLLIDRAELALGPGLNVVTGETGAGKTMLAHALDLLLGGKPRRGIVRPGAGEAYVEGVFTGAEPLAEDPELAALSERVPLGDELVLARRVTAEGRTRAYAQGRSVTAADLQLLGARLLAFYGQHEHRKLALATAQLDVLDSFCGPEQLARRAAFGRAWSHARRLERELAELRERVGARERDLDLLEFEIGEIEAAAPREDEERELELERARLSSVEALREAGLRALEAIAPEEDATGGGALGCLACASDALAQAAGADPAQDRLGERTGSLLAEAEELARDLRDYGGSLEADPGRLQQVTERLDLLARLKRKHGGSIAAVLAHAERCTAERERLLGAAEASADLEGRLDAAVGELEELSSALGEARRQAARGLERAVREELRLLAMEDASFAVSVREREPDGDGALAALGPRGADVVEFEIATNPGVPGGPLREVASGGELSRVMLALMSIASESGGTPSVVFDEVDAGVGGNTARAVAARLRTLAESCQVVCITHLAQVASAADSHFRVVKSAGTAGAPATAEVERLQGDAVVAEICRMLGGDSGDRAARRHAERLLQAA